MPLILRANDGERQELFFICVTSVTIYPPAEFQITIQTWNNCPSPLRAVAMQYTGKIVSMVPPALRLPYDLRGAHIPTFDSKYLDCDRRPAHKLKPLSRHPSIPEPQDSTYVLGSLELDL